MKWVVSIALVASLAMPAAAQQQDYFVEQKRTPLTYRLEGERTKQQKIVVASLAGGALLFTGIGALFTVRYQDAAGDVEAFAGEPTMSVYTKQLDERREDAEQASVLAGISYGIGGALVVATVIAFVATHPPDEIHEYNSSAYVAPVEGGAIAGKVWTW